MIDISRIVEKYDGEYLKFDLVVEKKSSRPDLHAFILLNEIVPGSRDIISAAEHDQFYLDVDYDKLAEVATEAQIIDLIRCGVLFDEGDGLSMFA